MSSIREWDPQKAPTKTAQDLLDTIKRWCQSNNHAEFGFTRSSADVLARTDRLRLRLYIDALVDKGLLVKRGTRFYPAPGLQESTHQEVMGTTWAVSIEPHKGQFRLQCTWCGPSSTKWATEAEALDRLIRTNNHSNRESHSLERSAVRG